MKTTLLAIAISRNATMPRMQKVASTSAEASQPRAFVMRHEPAGPADRSPPGRRRFSSSR
jgi:hypothetical protein